MKDFSREFPVVLKTDRDCESPLLTEFISARGPLDSLLDIGAHWSAHHYGSALRKQVRRYVGIDIQPPDPATGQLLDAYHTGNANTFTFGEKFDAVICVSTIEHAGVSTYKADFLKERMALFETCLNLSRKYVWISFPVGQAHIEEGQLAIITDEHLKVWEKLTEKFKVKQRFLYSQGPQASHPWREHSKRQVAVRIPYLSFEGNKSICVLEIEKV